MNIFIQFLKNGAWHTSNYSASVQALDGMFDEFKELIKQHPKNVWRLMSESLDEHGFLVQTTHETYYPGEDNEDDDLHVSYDRRRRYAGFRPSRD